MKRYTVLYDGTCGFCNFWVRWILKRDPGEVFLFAALQGEFGQRFLKEHGKDASSLDTLYLVDDAGRYWEKSEAILQVMDGLGGAYRIARIGKVFPKFLRDLVYEGISTNRKKLMGTDCYLPTPEERKRFLDQYSASK